MKHFFIRLLAVICTIVLIIGSNLSAFASENKTQNVEQIPTSMLNFDTDTAAKFKFELSEVSDNVQLSKGVNIETIKKGLQSAVNSKDERNSVVPQALTDPYEPNNNSDSAKSISYNQYMLANIDAVGDEDWY